MYIYFVQPVISLYNHNPMANQNIFGNNIQYVNCTFKDVIALINNLISAACYGVTKLLVIKITMNHILICS